MIENREIFIPHLYLAPSNDWATVWWKNYDDMLSRFHMVPERNGQTDGQTDLLYQYGASVC